jgi:Protein of unknown function (DUF2690)
LLAALAIPLAAGAAFLVSPTASAATTSATVGCSGYGCDGTDPSSTGCAANAITAEQQTEYEANGSGYAVGYVQLRYSKTCRTVWTRIIVFYAAPDGYEGIGTIYRNSDHNQVSCYAYTNDYSISLGGYTCYTLQEYDGGVTSAAYASLYDPSAGGVTARQIHTASY